MKSGLKMLLNIFLLALVLALPAFAVDTDRVFVEDVEGDDTLVASRARYQIPMSYIDPYEMTEEVWADLAVELGSVFKEDAKELFTDFKSLKTEGSVCEGIGRLKEEHPLRARTSFMLLKKRKPSLADKLQIIDNVNVLLMKTKIEMLDQRISLGDAFAQGSTRPYIRNTNEGLKAMIPNSFNLSNQPFYINLSTEEGEVLAKLEIFADESGNITGIKLISEEERLLIKSAKTRLVNIKTRIELDIDNFTKESGLRLVTYSIPDNETTERFDEIAESQGLKLVERAGVVDAERFNLENGAQIKSAKVIFKFEGNFIGRRKPESVQILRADSETAEVLHTEDKGIDEEGYLTFEAESDQGLSTFALFITEDSGGGKEDGWWSKTKLLVLGIILVLLAGIAFVMYIFNTGKNEE